MDTSLSQYGFVVVCISTAQQQKCPVSSLKGLNQNALKCYLKDCVLDCFVCSKKIQPQDNSGRYEMDTASPTGHIDQSACPVRSPPCPDDGCPANNAVCPESRIAYILRTSGTTGAPKLVFVPHCSILPNIVDLRSRFNITPDDVIFNAAPLTFDPSFVEVHKSMAINLAKLLILEICSESLSSLNKHLV